MKPTTALRLLAFLALIMAGPLLPGEEKPVAPPVRAGDPVLEGIELHGRAHPAGEAAFSWDQAAYRELGTDGLAALPIGVFDSGIGGLTVLEALLTADTFDNDSLQPGADGRPDLAGERFLYLGDQANMPYGNYPAQGREDYLRELILKDAVFLLGKRYHVRNDDGSFGLRLDKPPVKAIVIACNTATAYGLESVREALERWGLPVLVVGVVEAGARGLKEAPGEGAVGVLATAGTCASEVYPRTISRSLGLAGRPQPVITQWGSVRLAGVIEGDPAFASPLVEQVAADVRALVEAHREKVQTARGEPVPLEKIVLGCTHFPLAIAELDAAFETLRTEPDLAPWIAPRRQFINPAEWTARELFRELALARLRRVSTHLRPGNEPSHEPSATGAATVSGSAPKSAVADEEGVAPSATFYISVAHDAWPGVKLAASGVLDTDYKYQRLAGRLEREDTMVVPMTRCLLPQVSRRLVSEKLLAVWKLLPER